MGNERGPATRAALFFTDRLNRFTPAILFVPGPALQILDRSPIDAW
jgi:hypothetical protein